MKFCAILDSAGSGVTPHPEEAGGGRIQRARGPRLVMYSVLTTKRPPLKKVKILDTISLLHSKKPQMALKKKLAFRSDGPTQEIKLEGSSRNRFGSKIKARWQGRVRPVRGQTGRSLSQCDSFAQSHLRTKWRRYFSGKIHFVHGCGSWDIYRRAYAFTGTVKKIKIPPGTQCNTESA